MLNRSLDQYIEDMNNRLFRLNASEQMDRTMLQSIEPNTYLTNHVHTLSIIKRGQVSRWELTLPNSVYKVLSILAVPMQPTAQPTVAIGLLGANFFGNQVIGKFQVMGNLDCEGPREIANFDYMGFTCNSNDRRVFGYYKDLGLMPLTDPDLGTLYYEIAITITTLNYFDNVRNFALE